MGKVEQTINMFGKNLKLMVTKKDFIMVMEKLTNWYRDIAFTSIRNKRTYIKFVLEGNF